MLLRVAEPGSIDEVDWDHVRFRVGSSACWPHHLTLDLPHPAGHGRQAAEPSLVAGGSLEDILDGLDTRPHRTLSGGRS
jgi:hypothetical protein